MSLQKFGDKRSTPQPEQTQRTAAKTEQERQEEALRAALDDEDE